MIQAHMRLMKAMLSMPWPWPAWLGLLVAANVGGSLMFLHTLEAKVVLASIAVGLAIMTVIFQKKGFVRLLGLGHLPWVAMVPWLAARLGESSGYFGLWLLAVIVLNTLSLLIDFVDVVRYLRGERAPTVALEVR